MNAADLMTSFVVTVRPDATIECAAQLMLQYRISGLPVTDTDGAIGRTLNENGAGISRAQCDHELKWSLFD